MSDEDNVIKSTDVAPKKPTSFRDLRKPQLVEAATYFGTNDEGSAKEILADLTDAGVTWEMYVREFKLDGHDKLPEPEPAPFRQVDPVDPPEDEEVEVVSEVVTASATPVLAPQDKYLIKMTRSNPYFEFGRYKFTAENPYAIMTAADAQRILESETGFRQAFPAELQEFYS